MIKRIAVLSLLLVYMSTTVGFALTLHFCGKKVSDVRINQTSKKPCCTKEADGKPDNCCKDKHVKIKVSDQQQNIKTAKAPAASLLDLFIVPEIVANAISFALNPHGKITQRGPPTGKVVPLTIQNCTLRI